MLRGRAAELERFEELLAAVRAGRSAAVVVRGEPGIGKTSLLQHAASRADGARIVHAEGVEAEMELPFAGLQQHGTVDAGPQVEPRGQSRRGLRQRKVATSRQPRKTAIPSKYRANMSRESCDGL